MNSKILDAREERLSHIKEHIHDNGVVVVKANIVGNNKNLPISYILVNLFKNEVLNKVNVENVKFIDSFDGPYYILLTKKDERIKNVLIEIEEKHELGRFIDLDLFVNDSSSITRQSLNKETRKCYICNDEVIKCMRNKKHTVTDLIAYINKHIYDYLNKWVNGAIEFSILAELNLEHKFGLVTPTSSGSHNDMNYDIMKKAFITIKPYLVKMFWIGYELDNLDLIFKEAKKIGLEAEGAMFNELNNINCYKGLIFILGLALTSTGYALSHNQNYEEIYTNIQLMTKDIFNDLNYNTFGEYAYRNYNFGGARSEAKSGLISVQNAEKLLNDFHDQTLHMCLISIISKIDDSVLLKRSKTFEKYKYFKTKIGNILEYDLDIIKSITKECIKNNISCGGSADILITAVYMRLYKNKFI